MSPSTDLRENREFAAELKFIVSQDIADGIRKWARAHLMPDPHAAGDAGDYYRITSLYFDTEKFDVFHRNGSYGRSKFRIRRYGENNCVFLERKLKTRGLVSKRRSLVPSEQISLLRNGEPDRKWLGYWYYERLQLRKLRPICQIAYDRTARVTMTQTGPVRLTIDEGVKAWNLDGLTFVNGSEGIPLLEHQRIIEMKFRGEVPVLFRNLVEEFALKPQANSKYRLAVAALGLVKDAQLQSADDSGEKPSVCLNS